MKRMKMKEWIGNKIRDEGAKTISGLLKTNTSLTKLDLRGDDEKITNEKIYVKNIEYERLIENMIRDEGAKSISELLKINTSLTGLYLGCEEKIRIEKIEEIKGIKMKDNEKITK